MSATPLGRRSVHAASIPRTAKGNWEVKAGNLAQQTKRAGTNPRPLENQENEAYFWFGFAAGASSVVFFEVLFLCFLEVVFLPSLTSVVSFLVSVVSVFFSDVAAG